MAPVGAGEPCPSLQSETEACVHCEVAWSAWSGCSNEERSRRQYVVVEPVGNGGIPCLPLQNETEGNNLGI